MEDKQTICFDNGNSKLSEAMRNGFLTTEEFENVKKSIVNDLGFDPIKACGYHIAVAVYQRENKHYVIDPATGERHESIIAVADSTTAEDKWVNCTGRVIYMGSEAYKSGKFRKDRSFKNFTTYSEFIEACKLIAQSSLCPEHYKNNFADLTAVIQLGIEADISPYEALHRISIVDGMPVLTNKLELNQKFAKSLFEYIDKNTLKPWVKLGDYIVLPRHEGVMIQYRNKPVMLLADDRIFAEIEHPSLVSRY